MCELFQVINYNYNYNISCFLYLRQLKVIIVKLSNWIDYYIYFCFWEEKFYYLADYGKKLCMIYRNSIYIVHIRLLIVCIHGQIFLIWDPPTSKTGFCILCTPSFLVLPTIVRKLGHRRTCMTQDTF